MQISDHRVPHICLFEAEKYRGCAQQKEGTARPLGFRPDFPLESKSQGEVAFLLSPNLAPVPPKTRSRSCGCGWGGPGRVGPLPCGSILSPCEWLKGLRGRAGGLVQGGGAAHQSRGAFLVLLFLLLAPLPSLDRPPLPPPPPGRQLFAKAAGLSRGGGGGRACLASSRFLGNPASSLLARELGGANAAVGAGRGWAAARRPRTRTWAPCRLPWELVGMRSVKQSGERRRDALGGGGGLALCRCPKPRPRHGGLHSCLESVLCFTKNEIKKREGKIFLIE